jgi:tRNA(Ile)-lysidine synthase
MRSDSSEDARFVAESADRLGLPFELGVWTDKPPGRVGEKAARDARYEFLFEVARKHGANAVAVAHTRDDQAETVLFRIIRGTGVEGMMGMASVRQTRHGLRLIRPLLSIRRNVARSYLTNRGLPFREDPSNTDRNRTRNRIRHDLIPLLAEHFNPAAVEALARIGDAARDHIRIIETHINTLWDSLRSVHSPDEVVVPLEPMENLLPAERVLIVRLLCSRQEWPVGRMTDSAWRKFAAVTSKEGPKRWQGPDGITAMRTETSFVVRRKR